MKSTSILVALALALATALALPATARPVQVADPQVLEVGEVRLVLIEAPDEEQVTLDVALGAGSVLEPADAKGVAHVVAELATADVREWLAGRDGELTVETGRDASRIVVRCAPDDLGEALTRLASGLAADADAEAFAAAREAVARDATAFLDTQYGKALRAADRVQFGRFAAYRRVLVPAEVAAITAEQAAAFRAAHVGADRLVVGVTGPVTADGAKGAVAAAFDELGTVGPRPADPVPPIYSPRTTELYLVDDPDAEEAEVHVWSLATRRNASTAPQLEIWAWLLAKDQVDTPCEKYIVDDGLATLVDMDADLDWHRPGFIHGRVVAPAETIGKAAQFYIDLMDARSGKRLFAEEKVSARDRMLSHERAQNESPVAKLGRAVDVTFHDYPHDHYVEFAEKAILSSGEVIGGSAIRHILMKRLTIVAVGPAEEIREDLEYLAEVNEVSFEPASPSSEAEAIVDRMLTAMGGREPWANLRSLEIESETPAITRDERRIRVHRIQRSYESVLTSVEQILVVRESKIVLNGTPGFTLGTLGTRGLANSQYRNNVLKTRLNLYTLLHRLAIRDPYLSADVDEEGQLVLSDPMGEICRLTIGSDGRPDSQHWQERFAMRCDFETWSKAGDYVYAKELVFPLHLGRAMPVRPEPVRLTRFVPNVELDPEEFERPAGS